MKKFHFSLQAVLTLREREEQSALEKYAEALRAHQARLRDVQGAAEELGRVQTERRQRLNDRFPASLLVEFDLAIRMAREKVALAETALGRQTQILNGTLDQVLHARRRREILAKCEELERTRHAEVQRREEAKVLDELAARGDTLNTEMLI